MISQIKSRLQLHGVLGLICTRVESQIAALRLEDSVLAAAEAECRAQLSDEIWPELRNGRLIGAKLRTLSRNRQFLSRSIDAAVANLMQHRLAEERLAEQIQEARAEISALQEESDINESVGNAAAAFSFTQDL